jgi:membrane associated rhomboid family serine protease
MSSQETRYCYRHPDRETGLSCSECGRPICADCANFGPVGIRCPDHATASGRRGPAIKIKPRPVRRAPGVALSSGSAPITTALVAINVAIYLIGASQGGSLGTAGDSIYQSGSVYRHAVLFGPWVAHGGWYRLVTAMFLHQNLIHIGFNMFALWAIGRPMEQYLGTARYIGLYFVSGLAGSAGGLLQAPHTPVLGASGAIFGILGAMVVLEHQITNRLGGQAMGLVAINLVISFVIPGISWGGHVGGLIGGVLVMLAYAHWRDHGRAQYGQLGLGGVTGLVVVAAASVAIAYWRVRGYA